MKSFFAILVIIFACQEALAQYQKTINTNTLNISGFEDYYNVALSRQLQKKDNLALSFSFYREKEDVAEYQNYFGNLVYSHTFLRIKDFYLNAGACLFFAITEAEDIIGNSDSDNGSGVSGNVDLEYYLSSKFVLFSEARQLAFFNSDYYGKLFLYGFGLKIVF